MISLVTFSDDSMSHAMALCAQSAKQNGVDRVRLFAPQHLSRFLAEPELARQRGCGHWWWKAQIILDTMNEPSAPQYIIYADAGIEFLDNVNYIIDRMDQDIYLFGNQWEHAHWCKRDIIEAVMPVGVHGLSYWSDFGKQVQASVIFFRVNDKTRAFVKEWLDWCLFEGGRLIDDSPSRAPNHPEFQENRHDQAILTTMAYRDGYKLHWWPARYNMDEPGGGFIYPRGEYPDEGIPPLFFHHRRRNADWPHAVWNDDTTFHGE